MKLYGSTTSPYVRRIRLLAQNKDYEFINMDIFSDAGREVLRANNPTLKVPFIEDDGHVIFDSRVVFNYLQQKWQEPPLSWHQENLLTLIDAANDSLVQLLLSNRSGFNTDDDILFFNLQNNRIAEVFAVLEKEAKKGSFNDWHYPSICLYCLLDWCQFRALFDFSSHSALELFVKKFAGQPGINETDPR